jgi:hypothetical protein
MWGEERIANELLVKLGIRVSPRTVGKYMPEGPEGRPRGDQRWSTFLKNHARAILACDFFVAVAATFRLLYVFVVIEHGRRRLTHVGVTNHPTADRTLQQLREVVGDEGAHRYLIHDRDSIFARHLDTTQFRHWVAAKATLALNNGEWLRRGGFMASCSYAGLCPIRAELQLSDCLKSGALSPNVGSGR